MVRARRGASRAALTFECELGYTFDPAVWGQGFASEAAGSVRDYARDVLRLSYAYRPFFRTTPVRAVSPSGGAPKLPARWKW
jgi:hypothetical protein